MNSLKYIPSELKDKDLYDLVTRLIDHVYNICNDSRDNKLRLETPLIKDLVVKYQDIEAVNAYYNLFIKPIVGTRKAIESILSIIRDPGEIYEWFDVNIRNYRYLIQYNNYQNEVDILRMIHLCKALNNERSRLTVINSAICRLPLKYDESAWDVDYYDNAEGVLIEDVYVCLNAAFRHYLYVPTLNFWQQYVNSYTGFIHLLTEVDRWDVFRYDTRYRGDFINQITYFRYIYNSRFLKVSTNNITGSRVLDYENYDTIKDRIPFKYVPINNTGIFRATPYEQHKLIEHNLFQNNPFDYFELYHVSDNSYNLEDLYTRCGDYFELGISRVGYMETVILSDEYNPTMDASLNYVYSYISNNISSSSINVIDIDMYSTSGVVRNYSGRDVITGNIYQSILYEKILVTVSSDVLQEISTYYSDSSHTGYNYKRFIYDGTLISGARETINGSSVYPNTPDEWSSRVSIEINKSSSGWTIKAEPTVKSISNSQFETSTAINLPVGQHTIDLGEGVNPVYTRVTYNLTNNGSITFTQYDIICKVETL